MGAASGRSRLPAGEGIGEKDAGALVPVVGQRGVEGLHGESDLQVCDDEWGGHDLEAEDALGGRPLHVGTCECAEAAVLEVVGDAAQDLREVRARAAAGVEDVDVVGGQAVGDAEVVLQGAVDAGDHVPHHLGGVYQTPSCLRRAGSKASRKGS